MSDPKKIVTTKSVLSFGAAILLSVCISFYTGWELASSTTSSRGELTKQIKGIEGERKKLLENITEARNTLEMVRSDNSVLQAANAELQQQKAKSEKEMTSLSAEIRRLKSEPVTQNNDDQERQLADAKNRIDELKEQLQGSRQAVEEQKNENLQLKQKMLTAGNDVIALKKKSSELSEKNAVLVAQTNDLTDQVNDTNRQNENTAAQLANLATLYEEEQSKVTTLRGDMETLIANNDQLKDSAAQLAQQLQAAKDDRTAIEVTLNERNDELDTLKTGGDQLDLLRGEQTKLVSRLEKQRKNLGVVQSENSTLHNEVTSLKIKNNRLKNAASQFEEELGKVRRELGNKRSEVFLINSQLQDLKAENSNSASQLASLQTMLDLERQKVGSLEGKLNQPPSVSNLLTVNPPIAQKTKRQAALEFVREYYQDLDRGRVDAAVAKWTPDKENIRKGIQKIIDARISSITANAEGSAVHVVVRVRERNKGFETWDLNVFLNPAGLIWSMDGEKVN